MASALFSSCSKELVEPQLPASAELCFSHVATLDVLTRAGETTYDAGFKINMPANAAYEDAIEGREVTYSAGAWTVTPAIYLTPAGRTLMAWAPVALTPKTGTTFALSSALYDVANDLLYAKSMTVNSGSANVSLVMEHAYARLTFKLESENYPAAKILNALSVTGIVPTGEIDIATGAVSNLGEVAPLTLVTGSSVTFADQSALVVPATPATLSVVCTLDNKEYTVSLADITALAVGNEYVVTLKISGTIMAVNSVKVKDWVTNDSTVDLK